MATERTEDRKARNRQTRRDQIIAAARHIAAAEGWGSVTVRRLSDEIGYSQPVLYAHFENREAVVAAVAVEGFGELGGVLEKARQGAKRGGRVESVAKAYLQFAAGAPALYEAMFSLPLSVPFGDAATPPELRAAFAQLRVLFPEQGRQAETAAELLWASLHGIADLTRTGRLPPARQAERVRVLVAVFSALSRTMTTPPEPRS